jgi:OOP family OmpA-OmpF porin
MKSMLTTLCILYCTLNFAQTQIIPANDKLKLVESPYLKLEDNELKVRSHEQKSMFLTLPLTFSGANNTLEYRIEYDGQDPKTWGGVIFYLSTGDQIRIYQNRNNSVRVEYGENHIDNRKTIRKWKEMKAKGSIQNFKLTQEENAITILMNEKKAATVKTLGGEVKKMVLFTKNSYSFQWRITKMTATNVSFEKVEEHKMDITTPPQLLASASTSEYTELSPKITADGNTIFFTRDIDGANKSMYCEKQKDGSWSEAKMHPQPLNVDNLSVSIASAGVDGSTVYITGYRGADGYDWNKMGVSRTTVTKTGYEPFVPFEIKNYVNKIRFRTLFLSDDQQFLMISFTGEKCFGQQDIYVCFLKEDENGVPYYTEPLNLGSDINTAGNDMYGFLATDNKTLYISSDGYHGYGSNDFFVTKRLDDSWTKWSKPVNLGSKVNTFHWDAYFTTDASGEIALIAGEGDNSSNSDVFKVALAKEAKPEPVLIVSGKVLNKETNQPIDAEITFRPISNKNAESRTTRASKKSGEYKVVFQKGSNYEILAVKEGFFPTSDFLKLDSLENFGEVTKTLYLTEIKKGEVIRLNNIFFDFAKASLKEESFYELDRLVDLLVKNKSLSIKISGHTDNKGSESYNTKLSNERAQSVVKFLASKGIEVARLEFEGYGPSKPVDTNDTEEGRANNRRVEFTIL